MRLHVPPNQCHLPEQQQLICSRIEKVLGVGSVAARELGVPLPGPNIGVRVRLDFSVGAEREPKHGAYGRHFFTTNKVAIAWRVG